MKLKARTCYNYSLNEMKEKQQSKLKARTCYNYSLNEMKEMQKELKKK